MKTIPFDINLYSVNSELITRAGRKARLICNDAHATYPYIFLITNDWGTESIVSTYENGMCLGSTKTPDDIFIVQQLYTVEITRFVKTCIGNQIKKEVSTYSNVTTEELQQLRDMKKHEEAIFNITEE